MRLKGSEDSVLDLSSWKCGWHGPVRGFDERARICFTQPCCFHVINNVISGDWNEAHPRGEREIMMKSDHASCGIWLEKLREYFRTRGKTIFPQTSLFGRQDGSVQKAASLFLLPGLVVPLFIFVLDPLRREINRKSLKGFTSWWAFSKV